MKESQQRALELAFATLEDEFEHFLIIVSDKEKLGDLMSEEPSVCWQGGKRIASYMANNAIDVIKFRSVNRCPPQINQAIMQEIMSKKSSNQSSNNNKK